MSILKGNIRKFQIFSSHFDQLILTINKLIIFSSYQCFFSSASHFFPVFPIFSETVSVSPSRAAGSSVYICCQDPFFFSVGSPYV